MVLANVLIRALYIFQSNIYPPKIILKCTNISKTVYNLLSWILEFQCFVDNSNTRPLTSIMISVLISLNTQIFQEIYH